MATVQPSDAVQAHSLGMILAIMVNHKPGDQGDTKCPRCSGDFVWMMDRWPENGQKRVMGSCLRSIKCWMVTV